MHGGVRGSGGGDGGSRTSASLSVVISLSVPVLEPMGVTDDEPPPYDRTSPIAQSRTQGNDVLLMFVRQFLP